MAADPGNGLLRGNNATISAITHLYIDSFDQNGQGNFGLQRLSDGNDLYLYETGQVGTSIHFLIVGTPVNNGPNQWFDVTVSLVLDNGFTPTNNQAIQLYIPAEGTAGPPGPSGPQGPTGPTGPAGADGISFTWRGIWSGSTAYSVNDAVSRTNQSYMCKLAGTGFDPATDTTHWDLMAAQGATGATGAQGAVGPQGPAGADSTVPGPAGPTGATGATGAQGPAGAAATIAVGTTTTLAPGSAATVTNSGTSSAADFNFGIPQGITGATGAQGAQGPTGATGAQGVKGDTGAQGPQGTTGATGAQGPPGPTAVSTDAGNQSRLGSDSLIYTPGGLNGFISKTAAYTLTLADRNKYIICSGGSWTLTLPTAAAGLSYSIRNDMGIVVGSTTGTITLQPPAGTIEGAASLALLPQQECLVICDGTNWRVFGLKREVILGTQDITASQASGSVLLPAGFRCFELTWTSLQSVTAYDYMLGRFSTDGGSTWISGAASYTYSLITPTSATALGYSVGAGVAYITIACYVTSAGQAKMILYPGAASRIPSYLCESFGYNASVGPFAWKAQGFYPTTGLINALQYYFAASNIANSFLTVKGMV